MKNIFTQSPARSPFLISTLFLAACLLVQPVRAQNIIFKETFDNISGPTAGGAGTYVFPAGWTLVNVDNLVPYTQVAYIGHAWERREDFSTPNLGDSCAFSTSYYQPAGIADDWMWTPAISLSGINVELNWKARTSDPAFRDGYEVRIMTVPPTGGPGDLGNMVSASTILFSTDAENTAWTDHNIDLNSYNGQTVYIGFRNHSNDQFLLLVDNVIVQNHANHDAVVTTINKPEYTRTPIGQVQPIALGGTIYNSGKLALTNTKLNVKIYNTPGAVVYSSVSTAVTMGPGANQVFTVPSWLPTAPGNYTIKYYPSDDEGDELAFNDTLTTQYIITDSVFARDDDSVTAFLGVGQPNTQLGQAFTINKAGFVSSLTVKYQQGFPGDSYALLLWSTDTAGKPLDVIAATDTLPYTSEDAFTTTLPLHNAGVFLKPGTYVATAVEFNQTMHLGQTNTIFTPGAVWAFLAGQWHNVEEYGAQYARPFYLRVNINSCVPANRLYVDAAKNNAFASGLTWASASGNLDSALAIARSCSNITEIWVKAGTYKPSGYPTGSSGGTSTRDYSFGLQNGVTIYGGFAGTETQLSQRNIAANASILSGDVGTAGANADNAYHVIISVGNDSTAVLDGMCIRGGNGNGAGSITVNGNTVSRNQGGGMAVVSSSPTIRNCVFSNNTANYAGAMTLINAGISQKMVISQTTFMFDTAAVGGGAIYQSGGNVAILNCLFNNNKAAYGAAIRNENSPALLVKNSIFTNGHTVQSGAAMSLFQGSDTLVNNLILNNSDASTTQGGAVCVAGGNFYMLNNTFYGNTTAGYGGGLRSESTNGLLFVYNNIFYKNTAAKADNDINNVTAAYAQGNNSFGYVNPVFKNELDIDGPDNVLGTADDGLRLLPPSQALNAGSSLVQSFALTDITGAPRIQNAVVDLGAYEGAATTFYATMGKDTTVCKYSPSAISFTGHSGTAPYVFKYKVNGGTEQTISSTGKDSVASVAATGAAGAFTYMLTSITDSSGAVVAQSASAKLKVKVGPTTATLVSNGNKDTVCFGESRQVIASAVGGAEPFMFSINGGTSWQASKKFAVPAGTYSVMAKDSGGCTVTSAPLKIVPPQFKLDIPSVQIANNTITVTAANGFGGYMYNINGKAFQPGNTFTNYRAGTDTLKVQDRLGCLAKKIVTTLTATVAVENGNNRICTGFTRKITVSANAGRSPYTYSIDGSGTYQTDRNFQVGSGTHKITVKDAANATYITAGVSITAANINLSTPKTNVSCMGGSDGSITATASRGFGGYLYSINGGGFSATNIFTGLTAGTYAVSTVDDNGCTITNNVTINQPSTPCASFNGVADVTSATVATPFTPLVVKVYPVPSQTDFTLVLQGGDTKAPVEIRVMDMQGRTVYQTRGALGDTYRFGHRFAGGIYITEVRNGNSVERIKLVKSN